MKGSNIIAIAGALFFLRWLQSRKQIFDNASFFIAGLRIDGTLLNPELYIKIGVNNPTLQTQDINSVEGEIYLNDTILIGNVVQLQKQVIAANTTSYIELPVNVKLSGIFQTLTQLIKSKSGKYTFKGRVNVYGLNIPVNQSYTL